MHNKVIQQKKEIKKLHETKEKLMKISPLDITIPKKQNDPPSQTTVVTKRNQMTVEKEGLSPKKSHQIQVVVNGNVPIMKAPVLIIGDTSVRGLGSRIQSNPVEGQVIVRAGQNIENLERLLCADLEKLADGSTVVIGCGTDDSANGDSDTMMDKFESMIKTVEWENFSSRINVGILAMPPQKHHLRNQCAIAVNNFLVERIKSTNIRVINPYLSAEHLSRDGIHTNNKGKEAVAQQIRRYAIQPQGV